MPDTKITSLLTPQVTTNPATDVLPIVNIADTLMASSGSTRKITVNQLLSAGGTATLASATITGDLTVDTSTLKVDSANNRVGIGTATPLYALDVRGAIAGGNGTIFGGVTFSSRTEIGSLSNHDVGFIANSVTQYLIGVGGNHTWFNGGSTAMTLNSTGLGVGLSPVYKLQSVGFAAATSSTVNGSGGNLIGAMLNSDDANSGVNPGVDLRRWTGTALNHGLTYIATNATGDTLFYNGTAASNTRATSLKMTLDASGRLLVGPTSANTSGGVLQLSSGITFPATQVASSDANTLDDYVETTFSPTIVGSTVAGTATYTTQIGRATKIGRLVTFSIRVAYSAGTGIGNLRVGNLPFAAGAGSVFAVYAENIALTAGNYPVCGIISGNTFISIDQLPTGGGVATAVPYDAAGDIQISGSYIV